MKYNLWLYIEKEDESQEEPEDQYQDVGEPIKLCKGLDSEKMARSIAGRLVEHADEVETATRLHWPEEQDHITPEEAARLEVGDRIAFDHREEGTIIGQEEEQVRIEWDDGSREWMLHRFFDANMRRV